MVGGMQRGVQTSHLLGVLVTVFVPGSHKQSVADSFSQNTHTLNVTNIMLKGDKCSHNAK